MNSIPTMTEVANLLREAAERHIVTVGHEAFASKLLSGANQVEQMRCETCEWFDDTRPTGCFYPGEEFDSDCAAIDWCVQTSAVSTTNLMRLRMDKCTCTFAQKMVGDGCRYCNPQFAIDMLIEQNNEDTRVSDEVIRGLVEALIKIIDENEGWIGDHSRKITVIAEKALAQARKHLGE